MNLHKLSDTSKKIPILMVDTSGTAVTGLGTAVTVQVDKNGAGYGNATGTVAESGSGLYWFTPSSADVGTLGPLAVKAAGSGAVTITMPYRVVAFDPYVATNLGLSALPTATAGATGGLVTAATDVSGSQVPGSAGAAWRAANDNLSGIKAKTDTLPASFPDNFASLVISVGGAVTAGTVGDKTGYSLASTGLNSVAVTAPSGVASTFPQMVVQTHRRFFAKATKTATQIKTYADDGTTVVTTQAVSDDGATQSQGAAS